MLCSFCVFQLFFEILSKVLFIHPGRLRQIDYFPKSRKHAANIPALENPDSADVLEIAYQIGDHPKGKELITQECGQQMDQNDGKAKEKDPVAYNTAEKQWKLIALILDRIFAIIFFIVNSVIVVVLFPRG